MNFLAPWALLLSVVAAVPLLLHLLRRRSGERVDFPALRYLLRAEREHAREVRLRNLLLLLVRIALVLAIAAAVARPIGRLPGVGHPPTAVAILLDNSASAAAVVDGRSLLEWHREAARRVVAAAGRNDQLSVVTMDGRLISGSPDALRAALDSLTRIAGAGDAAGALRRADAALAASALPERRIAVLSDAQASTWARVAVDSLQAMVTLLVPDAARPATRGIASIAAEPPFWSPRGSVRATITGDSASWRLSIEGASVARGRAAGGGSVVARAQPSARGWIAGLLELEADEYRADDQRHFAAFVGEAPALAADAGSPFLREAVATLIASGRARAGTQIFLGSATRARRNAVLFAPANPLQVADANRALAAAGIPWRFGARRSGPAPLRGADLEGVTAQQWFALERQGTAVTDTLATAGRDVWAVAGEGYVLVASPADESSTDLLLRAAFLPWLERVVAERLGSASGRAVDVGAGQSVTVPRGVDALEWPDGQRQAVVGDARLSAPLVAGVYFWRRGDERVGAVVVNPEPAESELAPMPADSLAAQLGSARAEATPDALARATFAAGGRRALETPLLVAALLLLVAESWLARRGRTSRTAD